MRLHRILVLETADRTWNIVARRGRCADKNCLRPFRKRRDRFKASQEHPVPTISFRRDGEGWSITLQKQPHRRRDVTQFLAARPFAGDSSFSVAMECRDFS